VEPNFIDLAQLGAVGILLYINFDLWKRLNALQDRLFLYLDEGRRERKRQIAQLTAMRLGKEFDEELYDRENGTVAP